MSKELTKEELLKTSPTFFRGLKRAESATTDELFDMLNATEIEYDSYGFGGLQMWKPNNKQEWRFFLRNEKDGNASTFDCTGKTAKEAMNLAYAWFLHKGHVVGNGIEVVIGLDTLCRVGHTTGKIEVNEKFRELPVEIQYFLVRVMEYCLIDLDSTTISKDFRALSDAVAKYPDYSKENWVLNIIAVFRQMFDVVLFNKRVENLNKFFDGKA